MDIKKNSTADVVANLAVNSLVEIFKPNMFRMVEFLSKTKKEERIRFEKEKIKTITELIKAGVDPLLFDKLLTNEIDRRMKRQFGFSFLFLTTFFTISSYAIIILNAVNGWNISEGAITALIIETPIQFIGLLYIIARNLFPQDKKIDEQ